MLPNTGLKKNRAVRRQRVGPQDFGRAFQICHTSHDKFHGVSYLQQREIFRPHVRFHANSQQLIVHRKIRAKRKRRKRIQHHAAVGFNLHRIAQRAEYSNQRLDLRLKQWLSSRQRDIAHAGFLDIRD